jgi:hypothetical protein
MMEKKSALLAEGYMDVVALHLHGFTNSVGSLGTALTVDQVQLLKRYVERCYRYMMGTARERRLPCGRLTSFGTRIYPAGW